MSLTDRLALIITADGAGAIKEFNKVGAAAEKELGKAEDRTKKLGSQMQSTGVAMMGAAAVIGAGMYQAGKSAAELEQAVGGTEAVFETSSKVIDEWAKGADKSAGLSEEAARRLTTRLGGALQGLGFAQDEAATKSIELTQIGGDLAATYGGTTADAVQALGSAFRGEFDPLEQFNIFLKQSEVDAKAVSMGLAENTSHVDKNARAQATLAMVMDQSTAAQGQFGREQDTTAGRMAIATAQAENAKAAIGEGFMPVMSKAAGVVGGAATKFSELNEASNGTVSTVASVGVVLLGVAGAGSTLIGTAIKMKENFSAIAPAASNAAGSLRTVGGAVRGLSFAAAAAGVVVLTNRLQDNADEARRWANEVTGGGTLPEKIAKTTSELDKQRAIAEQYASLDFGNLLHISGSNEGRDAQDKMRALEDELKRLQDEEKGAKEGADLAARGVDQLGKSVDDTSTAVKDANKAWDDAKSALKGYYDQAFGTVDAERAMAESSQSLTDTIVENNATQYAAFDNTTKAGRDNQSAFEDAARAAIELGQKNIEAGGDIGQNTQMINNQIAGLREQAISHGISADKVDAYLVKLGLTPAQVTTQFQAPGLAEARAEAERLSNALGSAASQINSLANSGKGGGTLFGSTINLGFRAAGGPVDAGRPYLVGEKGPELMVPGSSGSIVNNDQLGQMAAAAGGSSAPIETTIILQVDGEVLARTLHRREASIR